MKLVVILLLFLVLGGVIYTLVGRTPAGTEALAGPAPPEEIETSPATLDTPEPAEPLEPSPAAEERTAILEAEVVAEEPEPAVAPDLLQGSVVFVDDSGGQVVEPSGTIEWLKWAGNSGYRGSAEVTDGTFELDVTEAETLSVAGLILDGQTAIPDEPDRRYPIDQGPIVVHAHRTRATLLSVLSEETGLHLDHVTVVKNTDWFDDDGEHPGLVRKGATVFTDVSSPLEYRPDSDDARSAGKTFFVHSPGHAWQPIRLDLNSGGEREMRLAAGGDVEFLIEGEVPRREARLQLRRSDQEGTVPFLEIPVRSAGPVEVVGLPQGSFRATVELGDWFQNPIVLAEERIEVVAGARGRCVLLIEAAVEVARATLAGTVVVPGEWKLDTFDLIADLDGTAPDGSDGRHELERSEMEAVAGRDDTWAFEFGQLPTGSYRLELTSGDYPTTVEYGIRITLGPEGIGDARLELPPPGTVVLRLVEAATGATADITGLHWSVGISHTTVRREDGVDHFEFLAPIGEIQLGSFGTGYDSLRETVMIHAGRNDVTFTIERECPLVIRLMDGETPIPFPSGFYYPEPEHLDGEGRLLYTRHGGNSGGFETGLSQPGRYVFELPEVPGFEPIPPQTITVARGEATDFVIQLVRK